MSDAIGRVLGRIPSGIFILTARSPQGDQTGMLASWVQQAAFDPPAITVAVNRKRYLNDWLAGGSPLALSIVGESQRQLLSHFGRGFEPGESAFDSLFDVGHTPSGLTVLSDAVGWLEGTVESSMAAGDHSIYVVRVTAAGSGRRLGSEQPYVHVRKNGLGY